MNSRKLSGLLLVVALVVTACTSSTAADSPATSTAVSLSCDSEVEIISAAFTEALSALGDPLTYLSGDQTTASALQAWRDGSLIPAMETIENLIPSSAWPEVAAYAEEVVAAGRTLSETTTRMSGINPGSDDPAAQQVVVIWLDRVSALESAVAERIACS